MATRRVADTYAGYRARLVEQLRAQGINDLAVLRAVGETPRHLFVPEALLRSAYEDVALPIGRGQTISRPLTHARYLEALELKGRERVLEIGTGSGYQAAVLAAVGCDVYTMEIFEELATQASARLRRLGYTGVHVRHGDGHDGWPDAAPFDAVIVTAAAGYIPPRLVDQLRPGGRMVIPVGSVYGVQNLILVEKDAESRMTTRNLLPVRFVPMLEGLR